MYETVPEYPELVKALTIAAQDVASPLHVVLPLIPENAKAQILLIFSPISKMLTDSL